jgi:hypothetical protein
MPQAMLIITNQRRRREQERERKQQLRRQREQERGRKPELRRTTRKEKRNKTSSGDAEGRHQNLYMYSKLVSVYVQNDVINEPNIVFL